MDNLKKIIWNDELSVGNSDIDIDHKQLIEIYNELIDFNETDRNRTDFALILSKMTVYCFVHFTKEEEYMEKMGYPDLAAHKRLHKEYIYKVAQYNIGLLSVNPPQIHEVIDFLEYWWVNHILEKDKKYNAFKLENKSDVKY